MKKALRSSLRVFTNFYITNFVFNFKTKFVMYKFDDAVPETASSIELHNGPVTETDQEYVNLAVFAWVTHSDQSNRLAPISQRL